MKRPVIKRNPINNKKGELVLHSQMLGCQHICKQGKGTQPVLTLQTAASVCSKSWYTQV